jgi:hypothetical protein
MSRRLSLTQTFVIESPSNCSPRCFGRLPASAVGACAGPEFCFFQILALLQHQIKIVQNAEHCLVYDRPLPARGLSWGELVAWWSETPDGGPAANPGHALYKRLLRSMPGSDAE